MFLMLSAFPEISGCCNRATRLAVGLVVLFCCIGPAASAEDAVGPAADFSRRIRPILSNYCFKCHGPDEQERKGGLRLDLRDLALKAGDSGKLAIVPGQPEASEVVVRLKSTAE